MIKQADERWEARMAVYSLKPLRVFSKKTNTLNIISANVRSDSVNVCQPNGYKDMFVSQSYLNPLFWKNLVPVYENQ